jgi:hypothetical protein
MTADAGVKAAGCRSCEPALEALLCPGSAGRRHRRERRGLRRAAILAADGKLPNARQAIEAVWRRVE